MGLFAETALKKCAGHILVRRAYAAINASDINYTAGRCKKDVGMAHLCAKLLSCDIHYAPVHPYADPTTCPAAVHAVFLCL